jgi:recombination protein RecA
MTSSLANGADVSRPVRPLPELLEALRDRGLRRGISQPGPMPAKASLPTGQPLLDAALGTGGWPRGALALLDAPLGGGATSLALGTLAACQAAGGVVAYLDAGHSLDPATASRLGVNPDWLLVVRPADAVEAVELAGWLAREGRIDALVLDLAGSGLPRGISHGLDRLADLLVRAGCVTLLLAGTGRELAGRLASVRVALRRRAWLATGRDLVGQRIEATVTRQRWALAGGRAELDLFFAEGRRVDALLRNAAAPLEEERGEQLPALRVVSA